ncbi:MAG: caspase family protein [Hyphomicrobiales bacterium]|nr:caspase family protein [Hyphomicrobiales bacterium]MBV9428452.1 caspase family protein [Bradyrhizobiaceae bacterium]
MWRALSCLLLAAGLIGPAYADDRADCHATGVPDAAVAACTRLIGAGTVRENQLADLYAARANAYRTQADFDRAIADYDEAIRIDPARPFLFDLRGNAWLAKRDYPHAITDYDRALQLNPKLVPAYVGRASAHLAKGDLDAALADYQAAIELNPKGAGLYLQRGHAWRRKGDVAHAIADYSEALRIAPALLAAHVARGITLERAGDRTGARADYEATIAADARAEGAMRAQATARERLAMLDSSERSAAPPVQNANASVLGRAAAATAPAGAPTPGLAIPPSTVIPPKAGTTPVSSPPGAPPLRQSAASPGNVVATVAPPPRVEAVVPLAAPGLRLALVIGNGAYVNATALPNPPNDAAVVAKVLREIGLEVIEGTNLDRAGMERLVRDFLHKAPSARVTLLYYAGHGMQVDGRNYLIPIDAKLAAPSDLAFETLELDKVLAGLDDEARANIVVLDACRDNPLARNFAGKLSATRSAAVPAGLAGYATVGTGTLIAFATAPGQTALDGSDGNSPFTSAFVKHVRTRGIEVNQMLTRVRVEVASATKNRQVPWANSSLLGEVFLAGEH